jgi:hypothetical protein
MGWGMYEPLAIDDQLQWMPPKQPQVEQVPWLVLYTGIFKKVKESKEKLEQK